MIASGTYKTGRLGRIGRRVAGVLLAICIPVLLISSTASAYTRSAQLYEYDFNKYAISGVTGISDAQLTQVARSLGDYFDGRLASPQLTVSVRGKQMDLYNDKELAHLKDIKGIVDLMKVLQIISILLFLGLAAIVFVKVGMRDLLRSIRIGAIVTAAFIGVLVVWSLIDFNSLFILFHLISFSNRLWILDPSKDYLIMMMPEGFFYDAALFMVLTILLEAIIIWVLGFALGKATGRSKGSSGVDTALGRRAS